MDENKYYTPELSEFYDGFEYELLKPNIKIEDIPNRHYEEVYGKIERALKKGQEFTEVPYTLEWEIRNSIFNFRHIQEYINEGRIRVKYLDEEDLKELGFEYIPSGKECKDGMVFKVDVFEYGEYGPMNDYTRVHFTDSGAIVIESNINWMGDPSFISIVFMGYIKNKSELKKLLKQIRVM